MGNITLPRGWHSRGYLPHFDGGKIPQSVNFRLADSIPADRIELLENELACLPKAQAVAERRKRIEAYLDVGLGDVWLRDYRVAEVAENALLYFDGQRYVLHAWVVMPNHVHALFTAIEGFELSRILHSWKSFTAKAANEVLGQSGQFWQEDYFERYIRNNRHYAMTLEYIEMNPVIAGLCGRKEDWGFGSARRRSTST
jgi:REP element-mobilizing transposase RayT